MPQTVLNRGRRAVRQWTHPACATDALDGALRILCRAQRGDFSVDETMAKSGDRLGGDSPSRPPRHEDESDRDDDEAPETPLDEPDPTPVQDPPAQPDKRPYTVRTRAIARRAPRNHVGPILHCSRV
jgi:hypothetical protein